MSTETKTLNQLRDEIHENAIKKGFYDFEISVPNGALVDEVRNAFFAQKIALIHSELSEALEADRKNKHADLARYNLDIKTQLSEDYTQIDIFRDYIKDTVEDELTDVIIRTLDLCGCLNIDIEKHIKLKMKYNQFREYKHGKKLLTMNRTIKFRGKRTDDGVWVYGDLIHDKAITVTGLRDRVRVGKYEVIPETVGQLTGLLDKNGKEIYEGDILKYALNDEEDTVARLAFSIQDGAYILCNDELWIDETFAVASAENSFVIGNIHDNPELLKKITMNKETLKNNYESACNAYLKVFCRKHDFEYEPDAWVGDEVGGITCVGDCYVDMATIRTDIDQSAPEDEFVRWYDYCQRAGMLGITTPNFAAWLKGCPVRTDEELKALEASKLEIKQLRQKLDAEIESIRKQL
jgi:uncharacterized phage protein (TIGR01671 family)